METRIERDSLGEMEAPADALYGACGFRLLAEPWSQRPGGYENGR